MRILVGMPTKAARGGINACEIPFIAALEKRGIEVREEIYSYDDKPASPFQRMTRVLRTARRLRQRISAERFDIIHLNTSFDLKAILRDATIVFFLGGRQSRIFLKFHGADVVLLQKSELLLRLLIRWMLSRVDGVGLLSSEERDSFIRAGVPQGKLFIVKNAVEESRMERDPEFRKRWEIDARHPILLFISRFIPAKGLIDVIHACSILRDRGNQFTLLCVGDGPARREAEDEVSRATLGSNVRFFGFLEEKKANEFYANSEMLVFPTYHSEGFSMVVFQSVAAGLPIITTRIRAAADYLNEPTNCLWVMPRDPAILAEKITQLLNDAELREAMEKNNRRLAAEFAPDAVVSEYIAVYNQLIKGGAKPRGQE